MKKTLLSVFAALSVIGGTYAQGDCDQTPHPNGYATYYNLLEDGSSNTVRCSFDAVNDIKGTFYGALHIDMLQEDDDAKYCGMCVQMTGPAGTEIVQIADECPTCEHHMEDIDLSPQAFEAIVGPLGVGISNVSWEEVSCPWINPLEVIIQGSNYSWAKVIIAKHVNRIAGVEIGSGGSWFAMDRGSDNGWVKSGFGGAWNNFIMQVRVTDIYGEQIIVDNIDLEENPTDATVVGATNFMPCIGVSTEEINSLDYVSIFPNPATNQVIIEGIEDANTIEILNINGSVVGSQIQTNSVDKIGVDISGLASGIYVVKMTGDNASGIAKFIKK